MSSSTPTISGFKPKKGDNFEITVGENTYKVENEGEITDESTIAKINNGTAYGNVIVGTDNILYMKSGGSYYQIGRLDGFLGTGLWQNSGYDDLKTLLSK